MFKCKKISCLTKIVFDWSIVNRTTLVKKNKFLIRWQTLNLIDFAILRRNGVESERENTKYICKDVQKVWL